ncbi:MAG TPA: hypothetical protein VM536_16595, partial [Chloroflexia bacterium]|nr:hypothetical protein [Chloroflexia bacterium]
MQPSRSSGGDGTSPPAGAYRRGSGTPGQNGRGSSGSSRPGPPPEPNPEETTPKSLRERLVALRTNARATVAGLPRAFALVWQAHRGFTIALAVLSIV